MPAYQRVSGYKPMPSAEYSVYVDTELAGRIEQHCNEQDLAASQFFKEAARNQLQAFEGEN